MTGTQEAVDVLDARGELWDMYRAMKGGWIVRLGSGPDDPMGRAVDGETIEAVLQAAIESLPVPKVPRRPMRIGRLDCSVEKDGSWWQIKVRGEYAGRTKTKAAAIEAVEGYVKRTAAAWDEWETRYAAVVATGVEGVDWRWER